MKKITILLMLLIAPAVSHAGDAATVIFESGQVVKIDDGFKQIVEAMKDSSSKDGAKIIELNTGGGSVLLKISEAVIVCRDSCSSVTVLHQLDPKRGGARANVNIENEK